MLRFCVWVVYLLFTSLMCCSALASQAVEVVAEEFAPYQYQQSGQWVGLSVDVITRLNEDLNLQPEINVYPWSRAYYLATHRANTVILSITKTRERQSQFHWIGELPFSDPLWLWSNASALSIDLSNWKQRKVLQTSLPRADGNIALLEKNGFTQNENLYITQSFSQSISLLINHRVDFILAGEHSFKHQLASTSSQHNIVPHTQVTQYDASPLAIAMSLGSDPDIVAAYQAAFQRLQASGELSRLVAKWLTQ